jgi:chaperonin GroES
MSTIKPLFARVLLKRETLQEKLSTSLIIPDEAQKRNAPSEGVVVAVGPTCDETIEVGQKVLFGRHAGDYFEVGDEEFYILADEDIIATIEE